jgi:hypothetical protein
MINLLWSGLNLLLLLGICYIMFRTAKLVRQHMGGGAMVCFILALLALGSRRAAAPSGLSKNLLAKAVHTPLANASANRTIDLGGSNKLFLLAEYDANGNTFTPHGLYASVSGLLLGHEWESSLGMLHQEGQQLHYWAVLNHHWFILGTPVFTSNGIAFEGTMKPRQPLAQR